MKRIALVGIAGLTLALAACTHTGVARPDSTKLVCAPEPDAPVPDPVTGEVSDDQDAAYKLDLRQSWFSCHSAVEWLHDWFARLPD